MWPLGLGLRAAGMLWKAAPVISLAGAGIGGTDYVMGLNKSLRDEYLQKGAGPDGKWTADDFNLWDRHVLRMDPSWFETNAEQHRQGLPIVQQYKKYGMPALTPDQSIGTYKSLHEAEVTDQIKANSLRKQHEINRESPEFRMKKGQLDAQTQMARLRHQNEVNAQNDQTSILRQQMLNQVNEADKNRLQQLQMLNTKNSNESLRWQQQMDYMDRKEYARDRADRMKLLIAGLSQLAASAAA